MGNPEGWGHVQGRQVREALCQLLEAHSDELVIRISLDGVGLTSVSLSLSWLATIGDDVASV